MPDPGKRDRLIILQRHTTTTDSTGHETQHWVNLVTVWAKVHQVQARERFRIQALEASEVATFEIRYRRDLTPVDRVWYQDKAWNIVGLAEIGRHGALEITAEAGA